jgi:hypothetical protein
MLEADAKMSVMPPRRFAALALTIGGSCDAMTVWCRRLRIGSERNEGVDQYTVVERRPKFEAGPQRHSFMMMFNLCKAM